MQQRRQQQDVVKTGIHLLHGSQSSPTSLFLPNGRGGSFGSAPAPARSPLRYERSAERTPGRWREDSDSPVHWISEKSLRAWNVAMLERGPKSAWAKKPASERSAWVWKRAEPERSSILSSRSSRSRTNSFGSDPGSSQDSDLHHSTRPVRSICCILGQVPGGVGCRPEINGIEQ